MRDSRGRIFIVGGMILLAWYNGWGSEGKSCQVCECIQSTHTYRHISPDPRSYDAKAIGWSNAGSRKDERDLLVEKLDLSVESALLIADWLKVCGELGCCGGVYHMCRGKLGRK